jgi:putative transposase
LVCCSKPRKARRRSLICAARIKSARTSAQGAPDKWRQKYGGLEVNQAKRLRQLDQENGRLKKLLAESLLDNAILKEVLQKK